MDLRLDLAGLPVKMFLIRPKCQRALLKWVLIDSFEKGYFTAKRHIKLVMEKEQRRKLTVIRGLRKQRQRTRQVKPGCVFGWAKICRSSI